MLNCIDNSGAAIVECVNVLRMDRGAKIGTTSPSYIDTSTYLPSIIQSPSSSPAILTLRSTGDRIIVVVQKQRSFGPEAGPGGSVSVAAANKVRRGDIRHAVVVRTHKKYQRPDGSVVRFDDNACVLINKAGEPIGSRLNGM